MVKSNQPSPIWPYLGILVCLFALAVTAPRGWQSLARRESIQAFLDRHPAPSEPLSTDEPTEPALAENSHPTPTSSDPHPEIASAAGVATETAIAPAPVVEESVPVNRPPAFAISQSQPSDDSADDEAQDDSAASDPTPAEPRAVAVPARPARPAGWLCVPRPEGLVCELALLSSDPRCGDWARSATGLLEQICQVDLSGRSADGTRAATAMLQRLRKIVLEGDALAATLDDPALEAQLRRADYSLVRRIDIWDAAGQLPTHGTGLTARDAVHEQALATALAQSEKHVRSAPNSAAWREYLQLDYLAGLLRRGDRVTPEERRDAARQLLARTGTGQMSHEQSHYVAASPVAELRSQIRFWTAEPVDLQTLLDDLEQHELAQESGSAQRLAAHCQNLRLSSNPAARQLGARLDEHYRNANVRLALAGAFLNRLVPQPAPAVGPFHDTIMGADVVGQSTTRTKLEVVLVPDRTRLRIGLEARGTVLSNTAASSGPATFYGAGESQFVVRKLFLCDARNFNVFPAQAEAEATRSDLLSIETGYDGVPLVGSVVRNIARSQHEDRQDQARWETEERVAMRARQRLEAEIAKAVDKMKGRYNGQVQDLLARLEMDLEPLALSTSEDRAVMRLRLAGSDQLAAYTPRPRAPADSLMSLQVHQSALNNALEKLQLEGRTFTLSELFGYLREKLNRQPGPDADADLPEDVSLTFASQDAVRVHCQDGRVQVRIALAELHEGKRHWHDFAVVTHYRPDTNALDIHFVRDGTIFLEGESLRGKPQIALRTIFSKVLSAQRGWGLLSPDVATDPRLDDVTISQFTVDQGWIGLAYAQRPMVARRPR